MRSLKLKTRNPQSPIRNLNETRHLVSYKNNGAICMVADRKVWPDARTGAKGQRPTHGRAGTGLASPAGTGAGANAIVRARSSDNSPAIYGWVSIQSNQPSPGRDERMPGIGERFCRPWTGLWTLPKREPSHKWLGYFQTDFNSTRERQRWPAAKTGRTQGPGQKANGQRQAGPGAGLAGPAGIGAAWMRTASP